MGLPQGSTVSTFKIVFGGARMASVILLNGNNYAEYVNTFCILVWARKSKLNPLVDLSNANLEDTEGVKLCDEIYESVLRGEGVVLLIKPSGGAYKIRQNIHEYLLHAIKNDDVDYCNCISLSVLKSVLEYDNYSACSNGVRVYKGYVSSHYLITECVSEFMERKPGAIIQSVNAVPYNYEGEKGYFVIITYKGVGFSGTN